MIKMIKMSSLMRWIKQTNLLVFLDTIRRIFAEYLRKNIINIVMFGCSLVGATKALHQIVWQFFSCYSSLLSTSESLCTALMIVIKLETDLKLAIKQRSYNKLSYFQWHIYGLSFQNWGRHVITFVGCNSIPADIYS